MVKSPLVGSKSGNFTKKISYKLLEHLAVAGINECSYLACLQLIAYLLLLVWEPMLLLSTVDMA